ncbi:mating locus protein, putative [Talaromyces stipitatus ATCC 10500]|uniref:Mating locus protein, putative n=1 Tax=Talaromyces stipitatus (strain ATCC 10500 / CBS 375.48 / QM 6759 / NRRL 1006) TaxID=441959 RepID=B8MVA2_TALSN|nr:mating locus protein, putative [Talaromyces stipitatus ATCC 10500]EED11558.1 mating locus protein, putative [Talaromyces stipitatus ATCC 10500]
MDRNIEKLLMWLGAMHQNPSNPPSRRYQAYYILNFYGQHRNPYRLMAQVTSMCKEELLLPKPSIMTSSPESSSLVKLWGKQIENVVDEFFIVPAISDFEAHPFELFSCLPPDFEGRLDPETNLKAHNKMLVYERIGQQKLMELTKRFGYHYVFRAGLREYFLTKLIAEYYNFMRVDNRSDEWRQRTQMTFYDLLDKHPNMKLDELRIVIAGAQAYPYDILLFRNWLIRSRRSYHAMQACISIMTDDSSEL